MKSCLVSIFLLVVTTLHAQVVKYNMVGRAYYDGTSQVYKLRVTDDGTGNIRGENVSILPSGRVLIGPVKGVVDYKNNTIRFQELQISNLPPGERQEDFCFFSISATFKIVQGKTVINGTFTSKHPSGLPCSGGTIFLIGEKDVTEIRKQYVKRIEEEKAKRIVQKQTAPPKPKPKVIVKEPEQEPVVQEEEVVPPQAEVKVVEKAPPVPPPAIPPSAKVYEYSSNVLKLKLIDYDQDDGDRVDLLLNDKPILKNYLLTTKGYTIDLDMNALGNGSGVDILQLFVVSEGGYAPASAKFEIIDNDQQFTQYAGTSIDHTFYLALKKKGSQALELEVSPDSNK